MKIKYKKGDATKPKGEGIKIICHICNDIGAWGAGFVLAVSKRWAQPEKQYRNACQLQGGTMELGKVQFVKVEDDTIIANIIGQHGIRPSEKGKPPIRYGAVRKALKTIATKALLEKEMTGLEVSVHMPKMGAGLAGGKWNKIERIVKEELVDKGVPVTVYKKKSRK